MIIRDNFSNNFYNVIKEGYVLILPSIDVDSICATRILTYMLTCDEVSHSVVPVKNLQILEEKVRGHAHLPCSMVLINCGISCSLVDFGLTDSICVYVIDSRRPAHLDNVFDSSRIFLLLTDEDIAEMVCARPDEIDIPSDEDENVENVLRRRDSFKEGHSEGVKAKELQHRDFDSLLVAGRQIYDRIQCRDGMDDRIWSYYENSWYAVSSAILMLEIACDLNKISSELMWCAVVGLSSQLMDSLITVNQYNALCSGRLCEHIQRFCSKDRGVPRGDDILRIFYDNELPLTLYSHWTLKDSMQCDQYYACVTKQWNRNGNNSLKVLFATLGITLAEANGNFSSIGKKRRKEIFSILQRDINETFMTFLAQIGYSVSYNSCDFACILAWALEADVCEGREFYEQFIRTTAILNKFFENRGDNTQLTSAVEGYKLSSRAVLSNIMQTTLFSFAVPMGTYLLTYIAKEACDGVICTSRHFLHKFCHFLQNVCVERRKSGNPERFPFIVALPLSDKDEELQLVAGLMPFETITSATIVKSVIGTAFEETVMRYGLKTTLRCESFDSSVVVIRYNDRMKFFEGLKGIFQVKGV